MSDGMVDLEVPQVIKSLLDALDLDANATREGPYNWLIKQGSARIDLAYHDKSGLIIGEAILCKIPPQNRTPLYTYLLEQNDQLEGLSFSLKEDQVVLSLLIHDRQFNTQKGIKLFQALLEKSDYYDDILIDKYGGSWLDVADQPV